MENCSFCGQAINPGTGKMYIRKDARILYFCSRRCEKNLLKLGRNPRNVTFTAEARKAKQQQMAAKAHAAEKKEHTEEAKAPAKKAAKKGSKQVAA